VSLSLLAVAGPSPLWYLTRGTGLVALILLTMTVVLGVANTGRWALPGWPRFATAALHRNVSLLVLVVLAIHIITAELDTFAPVGWVAVLIPFASAYRPIWLGLGTVAFDLLIALVATSLVRARIGQRAWRVIHWAAYAAWPLALVHGLGTGTDPRTRLMQAITVGCVVAVVVAVGWRLWRGGRAEPGRRLLGLGALLVASVLVAGWAAAGPLRAGWARRAGTPAALIASSRRTTPTTPATPATTTPIPAAAPATPGAARDQSWSASLAGGLRQQGPDSSGTVTITITGEVSGSRQGSLKIVLVGLAAGGGVALRHSTVTLALADGQRWLGQIVALDGDQMAATLSGAAGRSLSLTVNLQIDPATGAVAGTVTAAPVASGRGS
jgi:sulfoxide reductase heme-binding subunit YedZ